MFCQDCLNATTCKKVCKELNDYMSGEGIYSQDYIRPRTSKGKSLWEIPVGNIQDLEKLANLRAFTLKYGKKYTKGIAD